MTKGATKRTKMRRPARRVWTRRGPRGEVVMDFVQETTDAGAPEYNVTGVASIERISVGQVRIAKYSRRKNGTNLITHYEIWDYEIWKRSIEPYESAMRLIDRIPISDGSAKRREAH